MVSDQEIVNGVESLLRQSNPNAVTTINGVVQQLEAKLGLDLSHKAGFIRDLLGGGGGGGGGSGGGGGGVRTHHLPHPSPSPSPPSLQPKDHFTLQHFPQFHSTSQQFPSHFVLPPSHHQNNHHVHHHHPEEFNFRYPSSQQPQPQLYPYPHQHQHQHQHLHPQQQRQHPHPNPNPNPNPTTHPQLHQQGVRIDGSFAPTLPEPTTTENKKESAPAGTKRRGGPGGLNKVCCVSPELQAVVGEPALPRTQIVKQLWAYIRKHNLQDPSNKRKIICNDALRLLFDTDCTDMFKMNKLLSRHITPLDPTKEPGPDSKRLKTEAESATESTEASSEASPEAASDAGSATVIISDALSRFFETEEREMPQSEAVRRVWEYIKVHQLEDHQNPMMIICDSKLQELFGCENISALEIAEMLMTNFVKQL